MRRKVNKLKLEKIGIALIIIAFIIIKEIPSISTIIGGFIIIYGSVLFQKFSIK